MQEIYDQWKAGKLTLDQAFHLMSDEYGEIDSTYEITKKEYELARALISEVVAYLGGKAEVKGYADFIITSSSRSMSWDKERLDELLQSLRETDPELAKELEQCRKETTRSGGLQVRPKKKG